MALKDPRSGRWWSRLHFAVRFTGVTAMIVALVGLTIAAVDAVLTWEVLRASWHKIQALTQKNGEEYPPLAISLFLGGVVVGLLWLFIEMFIVIRLVAGRRSAFGFNAVVQLVLAAAVVIGVNVYSSQHFLRLDLTTDQRFTLPTQPIDIPDALAKLRDRTTIVVYQRNKTFGLLSDKADGYDSAALRKVVDKVKDLAGLFQEFGPQFQVEVLEVEEGYEKNRDDLLHRLARAALRITDADQKLSEEQKKAVTGKESALRELIENTPENSIFFFAGDNVQRLGFNDFYQLDKTASKTANGGEGNLVLLYQGVDPFARKALNIDEKRPRVGIAVIHEWLTTRGGIDEFTMAGAKKVLEARGIDVRDIVLRRWNQLRGGPPEPAAYTYDENKFEVNVARAELFELGIKQGEQVRRRYLELQTDFQKNTLDNLTKKYAREIGVQRVTPEIRDENLAFFQEKLKELDKGILHAREQADKARAENAGLNVEGLEEKQRMSDLKAKLDRELADIDLLILPRMTLMNLAQDQRVPNELYKLDPKQVAAIKDFVKAGKPVLLCFGPINEPGRGPGGTARAEADELEDLFGQLGIQFGKTTILFEEENSGLAQRRSGLQVAGMDIQVPPVEFDWPAGNVPHPGHQALAADWPAHPIRGSMKIAQRSLGARLDVAVRYPRPIGFDPALARQFRPFYVGEAGGSLGAALSGCLAAIPFVVAEPTDYHHQAEFMITSPESWNEDNPFQDDTRTPSYQDPKLNDPRNRTFEARRHGPFPVAVALETRVPAEWYDSPGAAPTTVRVRVAAIGDGGLFVGPRLSPAKERLFIDTCNWLLGRDDRLPRDHKVWEYPRVDLSPRTQKLWKVGAWLGPPFVFFYLGLVVMFVRRLR